MDKIVIFPGNISSNFFTNELPYIKKHFEIALVIAYTEPQETIQNIISEHRLPVKLIKDKNLKVFFTGYFWKWLFCKNTRSEIKSHVKGKYALQKFFYILYYGCFCAQCCQILDKIINTTEEKETLYLYSYWLSRSAYAASYYRMMHFDDSRIKQVVSRAHRYDLYENRNQYQYLPFRRTINQYLNVISFIADDGKDYFNKQYSFSGEGARKQVIHLGTYNKNGITKKIYPKDTICLISCSVVRRVKRLDLIIELVAQLNDNVHWIHIGAGDLFDEIKMLAQKKLPSHKYSFIGQVSNDQILEQFDKYDADFFINLSDSEGIPVSIMEAMSYGLPCIGRDVGGMNEIITSNTGLLLQKASDNVALVTTYLNIRLNDIKEYEKISNNCKAKWNAEYNAKKNYEIFFGGLKHE